MTLFTTLVWAAPCSVEPWLTELEAAAWEGREADGERLRAEVDEAWSCAPPASRREVTRRFLAEAVLALVAGDEALVDDALAAAARSEPDYVPAALGPQLIARLYAARGARETGSLEVEGLPEGFTVWIDGRSTQVPAVLDEGLHVVQVVGDDGAATFGRIVQTGAGDLTRLRVPPIPGAPPPAPTPAPEPATAVLPAPVLGMVEPRPIRRPGWLVVAGAAAVGATGFAVGALSQDGAMRDATDLAALDAAYGRQQGFAGVSYGLMGIAAISLTVGVAANAPTR